ncbi:flagellar biosynthesis protein FlhF, partial [Alcaligenaceae bacterium]|nr:flagellar biosynthesis protein FlhF [Alcaligenaceae bacterium]
MNISRFFGATNREALRQVRLALGPDALIVSNRRVNGGVEILAADPTALAQLEGGAPPPQAAPSGPAMPPASLPAHGRAASSAA